LRTASTWRRAQRQQQRTMRITPKRADIYDRNMHALAMSVPVKSAFAVPAEIADESLRRLAFGRSGLCHRTCLRLGWRRRGRLCESRANYRQTKWKPSKR